MRKVKKPMLVLLLLVLALGAAGGRALAGLDREKIVVLDFLALDDQGRYIDTLSIEGTDLTNLSRVMSQGIAARLVQYGEFEVENSISLSRELDSFGFAYDASAWDRAEPF